jgi:hypothetical protein
MFQVSGVRDKRVSGVSISAGGAGFINQIIKQTIDE